MKFNEQHKVIVKTLSKDEAAAFIKFLESEIVRHQDDIYRAKSLIRYVRKAILGVINGQSEDKPKNLTTSSWQRSKQWYNVFVRLDNMISDTNNSEQFRTSETALAAYLVSEGFGTPEIEYNGTRAFFLFPKDAKLEKHVAAFDTALAKGDIVLFFNAYQVLLRRIKERY